MDVRAGIRHDDGWGFLHRVEHQLRTYDPDVVAVQLNLLGSHDTRAHPHDLRRRPGGRPARHARAS